jgi:hypothetical protein
MQSFDILASASRAGSDIVPSAGPGRPRYQAFLMEGILLLRRSHWLGKEIMDETKTARDQEIPLPTIVLWVLREHVKSLEGKMAESDYLFPSTTGGLRSRSALDKPFRDVVNALKWDLKVTPRAIRRTFQDLARRAQVHYLVTRAISGHATTGCSGTIRRRSARRCSRRSIG